MDTDKPDRILIVGGTDCLKGELAQRLAEELSQPVVINPEQRLFIGMDFSSNKTLFQEIKTVYGIRRHLDKLSSVNLIDFCRIDDELQRQRKQSENRAKSMKLKRKKGRHFSC